MKKYLRIFLFTLGMVGNQGLAGTILTTHLPANTAIINIDATKDGANLSNGGQTLWYAPFSTVNSLLEYTVTAGTYRFRIVNPADAAQLYPALTTAQTSQIFTAWTFNTPWLTDYLVFKSAAATDSTIAQLFDGAYTNDYNTGPWYANAATAYDAAIGNGCFNKIRPGAQGRYGTNLTTSYTFTNTTTLIFVIPDNILGDNFGGVSVLVSPVAAPTLSITATAAGQATVSWTPATAGFVLQESPTLSPAAWTYSVSGATNPAAIFTSAAAKFYRLSNP